MINLIYSVEPEMARRTALKMIKKDFPTRDETNFISFNMVVSSIEELAEECRAFSLMSNRKAILAENCAFLAKNGKTKKNKLEGFSALLEYCKHPNEEIDLYLVVYSGELDSKNEIVMAIAETGYTKEIPMPSPQEWIAYTKRYIQKNGSNIEDDAAEELIKRIDGDYGRFLCELAKLDAFASGSTISRRDIVNLVSPRLEEDTFELSNMLLKGNIEGALKVYADLKKHSNDEVALLNMLSSQFRFLDEVQYLSRMGKNKFDIASELKASPGRVGICLKNLREMRPNATRRMLERLYRCQKGILTGKVNAEFAFSRLIAETSI